MTTPQLKLEFIESNYKEQAQQIINCYQNTDNFVLINDASPEVVQEIVNLCKEQKVDLSIRTYRKDSENEEVIVSCMDLDRIVNKRGWSVFLRNGSKYKIGDIIINKTMNAENVAKIKSIVNVVYKANGKEVLSYKLSNPIWLPHSYTYEETHYNDGYQYIPVEYIDNNVKYEKVGMSGYKSRPKYLAGDVLIEEYDDTRRFALIECSHSGNYHLCSAFPTFYRSNTGEELLGWGCIDNNPDIRKANEYEIQQFLTDKNRARFTVGQWVWDKYENMRYKINRRVILQTEEIPPTFYVHYDMTSEDGKNTKMVITKLADNAKNSPYIDAGYVDPPSTTKNQLLQINDKGEIQPIQTMESFHKMKKIEIWQNILEITLENIKEQGFDINSFSIEQALKTANRVVEEYELTFMKE